MSNDNLSRAIKSIAWGYVFLHLDFSLGSINILPAFVCYVLILKALPVISEYEPSAMLLRPLGIVLGIFAGIEWLATAFGYTVDNAVFLTVYSVLQLYFHFQLLTNLADIANATGRMEARKLLILRTVRTIFAAVFALPLNWGYDLILAGIIFANIPVVIWTFSLLFSFSKALGSIEETA